MSTRMDEDDWAHTLAVFRACLPRRGRKGKDDRRFLEALHFFTVENVRWRALPERVGHWNSVWKRFDRLSKAGVFEAFFDTLASMSSTAHLIQMFDSTIVRAHVSAAGAAYDLLPFQTARWTIDPLPAKLPAPEGASRQ